MSARIVGRILERIVGDPIQKAVLVCLGEHSNPDGEMAFPSVRRICLEMEFSESAVRHALSKLRARHLIVQTATPAQHRPATYRVDLEALSDLPVVEVYRPGYKPDLQDTVSDLQEVQSRPPRPGPKPSTEPSLTIRGGNGSKDQTPWVQALWELKKQLRRQDYDTWVRDSELVSLTDGEAVVGVMNAYAAEWLREHVGLNVREALAKVLGREVSVRFVVMETA